MSPPEASDISCDSSELRAASEGETWKEVFLNEKEAGGCSSTAISVMLGHSILVLESLATDSECDSLCHEAIAFARTDKCESFSSRGRARVPLFEFLSEPGQAVCDQILQRALKDCIPEIIEPLSVALFGKGIVDSIPSEGIIHNPRLEFSEGEPAINVYSSEGEFKPHKDKESLTLLLNLSGEDEYSGGGTAFYSLADLKSSEYKIRPTVTTAVRPPKGVAVIFAGSVMHAGLPVLSGNRCVFVGSFSPKR